MITFLYNSFIPDTTLRPDPNWTSGLKSAGITGITVITNHSGLFPEVLKLVNNSNWSLSFLNLSSYFLGADLVQSYPCNFALPEDSYFMRGGNIVKLFFIL